MELDWFTLIAQVVNFLVLVALLRHFLYGRIIRTMETREEGIAARLDEAAQARATAEQEAEALRSRNREFDEQRDAMLAQVNQEVAAKRQQLIEDARRETEQAQAQWLATLDRERHGLLQEFRTRLGREVFTVASHGLKDLADADLEEQMLRVFVQRLATLDAAERESIVAAIREADGTTEIRTAFTVHDALQDHVSRALRDHLGDDVVARFVVDPELIGGVELWTRSHRLPWSLAAYLDGMEERVLDTLDARARNDDAAGG